MADQHQTEQVVLDPSHTWGQRPILERVEPGSNRFKERMIPCCLDCLVDGYEDEPDALAPCRRPGAHEQRNRPEGDQR